MVYFSVDVDGERRDGTGINISVHNSGEWYTFSVLNTECSKRDSKGLIQARKSTNKQLKKERKYDPLDLSDHCSVTR